MLEIQNVSKTFNAGTVNQKTALNGLNLKLNEGDFVTVIGGNGAGKSTMLNAVAGVWPVDEGKILYYEDKQLVERTPEEVQEELDKRVPSPLNEVVSYGASAACWLVAQQSGMLEDLKKTFGAEVGADLLRLAVYQYLDGGSMDCFEQWASQH